MPTMSVSLTAEMVDFVEEEVSSGDYVSASEVVRDALRMMRHEKALEGVKLRLLRDEIDRGYEQARRGEFSGRSIDEIAQSVLKEREI
jgi:antitoxin ParD1/3/4